MRGTITSIHNPKIKSLLLLEKPRERRKQCQFVVEGTREIRLAIDAGYRIGNIFYCEDLITPDHLDPALANDRLLVPVTQAVFDKIAVRENSGGVVAIAEQKVHHLDQLKPGTTPLLLVLESVEKPGNLGAILRTASGVGADAVIICDPQTDFYNPNVIRSSLGNLFTVPTASATSEETIAWLQKNKVTIFCTYLKASKPYYEVDLKNSCAIVMGTEATGLSKVWVDHADQNIIIPMHGAADSLNVSVATAVVAFEARRQREQLKIQH